MRARLGPLAPLGPPSPAQPHSPGRTRSWIMRIGPQPPSNCMSHLRLTMEDALDCPLCCTELDVTDRAIQYCECGCEWRRGRRGRRRHRRQQPPPARLPAAQLPTRAGPALQCPIWGVLARGARTAPLPRLAALLLPLLTARRRAAAAYRVPRVQTRCACGATITYWRRLPRPAWRRAAPTAAPSMMRRRSRCSTLTQSSEWGRVPRLAGLMQALDSCRFRVLLQPCRGWLRQCALKRAAHTCSLPRHAAVLAVLVGCGIR